ncbi:hypothetical protein [Undibacterium sp. CY21W]|uniref:hypothetical protein n=1 Tax=Undibacterium sp. CY21W TaxID=2762293 RepID=UPI00164BEBD2|nr:hypothetical protein [Undibacterium sp. CY21W]MBC3927777.1 hypothetical protein [Undibacterium sp. CY21W]
MTTTLRERYLDQIVDLIRAIPGITAVVDRSVSAAFEVDDSDVIVIHRGKETPEQEMHGATDRTCDVMVSVVTRNSIPERVADGLMSIIHPAMMHFSDDALIDITEGITEQPRYGGENGKACMISTHYFILYRTDPDSLVQ